MNVNKGSHLEKQMKICQVMASCGGIGGLEKHCADLCNRLSARHDVVVVAHENYRSMYVDAVRFEAMDMKQSRWHPGALWHLRRIIRRYGSDVVHAQANKATAMVRIATWGLDCKTVATIHGLKKNTNMYNRFDRVIAVSEGIAQVVRNQRCEVIYNGIELPELPTNIGVDYLKNALGLSGSRRVVVSVGRLVDVKGFDVLVKAWSGIDANLVIVGEGPLRCDIELLIKKLELDDRVHLAGYRDDVPAILAGADMVVISSRREGFPYVMTEALLVKQVIVSTRVPGAREILPKHYLVDCENHQALHDAIVRHLSRLDEARHDFEPVWDMAERELTVDEMVRKTENVYSKVLSNPQVIK